MADDDRSTAPLRRTWPQRLLVVATSLAAVVAFLAAGLVWFAQQRLEERQLVAIDGTRAVALEPGTPTSEAVGDGEVTPTADVAGAPASDPSEPTETFPTAGTGARNILVTGADNNACLDPSSPYAPAFGDRDGTGERSDTIMMWRVNPDTAQVAVLSFPRDLWLPIAGRSGKGRINSAYERDDPQRLIDTIREDFGISTDHFVQVDFCAFAELVDAVGGVAVPFDRPVRDPNTGLNVPEAGCFTFTGDHALAYVRSRKLEYLADDGTWTKDPSSDLGRISRQQDFIRRVGDELLANAFSPSVVRTLFDVSRQYIVTDQDLTLDRILSLAGILTRTDPADITTYQIEARNERIQGKDVLVMPSTPSDNMEAVLELFRGEITLADRPEQDLDASLGGTSSATAPATTTPVVAPGSGAPTTDDSTGAGTPATGAPDAADTVPGTVPAVEVDDIVYGVVPDPDVSCT